MPFGHLYVFLKVPFVYFLFFFLLSFYSFSIIRVQVPYHLMIFIDEIQFNLHYVCKTHHWLNWGPQDNSLMGKNRPYSTSLNDLMPEGRCVGANCACAWPVTQQRSSLE